jgi:hypothetical protein
VIFLVGVPVGWRAHWYRCILLVGALGFILSSGCSVVGYGIGREIDLASSSRSVEVTCNSASELIPGALVKIKRSQGTTVRGRLHSVRCDSDTTLYVDVEAGGSYLPGGGAGGRVAIRTREVERVELLNEGGQWRMAGGLIGLTLDVIVVTLLLVGPLAISPPVR